MVPPGYWKERAPRAFRERPQRAGLASPDWLSRVGSPGGQAHGGKIVVAMDPSFAVIDAQMQPDVGKDRLDRIAVGGPVGDGVAPEDLDIGILLQHVMLGAASLLVSIGKKSHESKFVARWFADGLDAHVAALLGRTVDSRLDTTRRGGQFAMVPVRAERNHGMERSRPGGQFDCVELAGRRR